MIDWVREHKACIAYASGECWRNPCKFEHVPLSKVVAELSKSAASKEASEPAVKRSKRGPKSAAMSTTDGIRASKSSSDGSKAARSSEVRTPRRRRLFTATVLKYGASSASAVTLVDTGLDTNLIDQALAEEIKLPWNREEQFNVFGTNKTPLNMHLVGEVQAEFTVTFTDRNVGGHAFTLKHCAVVDRAADGASLAICCDSVLEFGRDFPLWDLNLLVSMPSLGMGRVAPFPPPQRRSV